MILYQHLLAFSNAEPLGIMIREAGKWIDVSQLSFENFDSIWELLLIVD